jgi:hypothetical protein
MGEWMYSITILYLGIRWRWVVSFMPRGNRPLYPLDRRLGGHRSWSELYAEERNLAPAEILTPAIQPIPRHSTD